MICFLGLDRCLLAKDEAAQKGLLVVNFDPAVLNMLQEVQFWEGLRLGGPYVAMEINAQRQKYKILRESALVIVRDYNAVSSLLDVQHTPIAV